LVDPSAPPGSFLAGNPADSGPAGTQKRAGEKGTRQERVPVRPGWSGRVRVRGAGGSAPSAGGTGRQGRGWTVEQGGAPGDTRVPQEGTSGRRAGWVRTRRQGQGARRVRAGRLRPRDVHGKTAAGGARYRQGREAQQGRICRGRENVLRGV